MKVASALILTLAFGWPLVSQSQTPNWKERDWIPLVNEPSRQDLLQLTLPFSLNFLSLPRNFRFPADTNDTSNGPRIFGIDISHYTPSNIGFATLTSKNIHYVYVKATQGVTFKDSKFAQFWKSLGDLPSSKHVARGAYHFLSSSASESPTLQAERFVAYVNLHGGFKKDDLPPVVDLEWDIAGGLDSWRHRTPQEIVATVLTFMARVEALTGKTPMLYTARSWWRERQIAESEISKFSRYPIWIADYSTTTRLHETPRGPNGVMPTLWQFTDRAKISGGPAALLDANVFDGTVQDFARAFGLD